MVDQVNPKYFPQRFRLPWQQGSLAALAGSKRLGFRCSPGSVQIGSDGSGLFGKRADDPNVYSSSAQYLTLGSEWS